MFKKQFGIFLIIGALTVLIDYSTYRVLLAFSLFSISLSKGFGFILGTIFSYFANKLWTFSYIGSLPKSIYRFIGLYLATLGLNIGINALCLTMFAELDHCWEISFLIATAFSAIVNFMGMKFYVFKQNDQLVAR